MSAFDDLAGKVRRGEPIPLPLDLLLAAGTPVVRAGMFLRSLKPKTKVNARVISIGNITVGGTGKTPAVIERARAEIAAGRKVAVLTRGYGAPNTAPIEPIEPGANLRGAWKTYGDEPVLIAAKAPGVIVVKCRVREAGARWAIEEHGCDTLILDDGFQYVSLHRDENIVLVDATNPFGNGHLLPRGILREPVESMRRATDIVVTRADYACNLDSLLKRIRSIAPDAHVRVTVHKPVRLRRLNDGGEEPLTFLRGREVDMACAIANPEAFEKTLVDLGASIRDRRVFPDHKPFNADALDGSVPTIVTEKDAVRLESPPPNVYALEIELSDFEIGN